jgi:hypothetical protein
MNPEATSCLLRNKSGYNWKASDDLLVMS